MMRWLVALALVVGMAAPAQGAVLFRDDFDGTGLDGTKWTPYFGDGGANEQQAYTDRAGNLGVASGSLRITALRESYNGKAYTAARISTAGKFRFRTGTVEFRAQVPTVDGVGPAVWSTGFDGPGTWPQRCENDYLEYFAGPPRLTNTPICASLTNPNEPVGRSEIWPLSTMGGWHTYRVQIGLDRMLWTVDGVPARNLGKDTFAQWMFDRYDHYLVLNVAVGGDRPWGQPTNTTPFPQTMYVDYITVTDELPTTPAPTTAPPGTTAPPATPAPTVLKATDTIARSARWNVEASTLYSYFPNEWVEYVMDTRSGTLYMPIKNQGALPVPPGYTYQIKVAVDGVESGTVAIAPESVAQIPVAAKASALVRLTWLNDAWQAGQYDANLMILGLTTRIEAPAPPSVRERIYRKLVSPIWTPMSDDEAQWFLQ